MEELKKLIDAVHPLPDADWSEFSSLWKPFSAKRKEILTRSGEVEKYLYFVVKVFSVYTTWMKRIGKQRLSLRTRRLSAVFSIR